MSKKNKSGGLSLDFKVAKAGFIPDRNKASRIETIPSDRCSLEFRADQMDLDGDWGWSKIEATDLQDLLSKIFHSQKMTWQMIRDNGSHFVDVSSLIPKAQKRLKELKKDDVDELYSLRLSGPKRVWGIKDNQIFWLLWWDPCHQICPSFKKNT